MSEWNTDIGKCPLNVPVLVKATDGVMHLCIREADYPDVFYYVGGCRVLHSGEVDSGTDHTGTVFDCDMGNGDPVAWMVVDFSKMVKDADAKVEKECGK